MIEVNHRGSFDNTEKLLRKTLGRDWVEILDRYGQIGVELLRNATPVDTGLTAASWDYELVQNGSSFSVHWLNHNIKNHVNIAIILDTGHASRNGSWVSGYNYIDPALQPIFQEMAEAAWMEVTW